MAPAVPSALRDAQTLLAAVVESSNDAIISKTLEGVITSWNPAAERLFGYSAAEAIGRPVALIVPDDRPHEEAEILARIAGGEHIRHFETVRLHRDGTRLDVSVSISPVRDGAGQIVGASKIARDIGERKRAEARLRAQLGRLQLLDQITGAIAERQDLQSIYQVAVGSIEEGMPLEFACVAALDAAQSRLVVTRLGARSATLPGALAAGEHIAVDANGLSRCVGGALVYESDTGAVDAPFAARLAHAGLRSLVMAPLRSEAEVFGVLLAARRAPEAFSSGDCEFLRQLSAHVSLAARQAALLGSLQRAYEDLRRSQQAALQHERLRAVGQMASGIAHDINNAISPALLYGEALLEAEHALTPHGREQLEGIVRALGDVAATVERLREFYRPRDAARPMTSVSVNALVPQVVSFSRARWGDMARRQGIAIDVRTDLAPELPTIVGSESEIREALINLIFNALDALTEGGTLRIATRPWQRGVQVDVADSGIGMNAETLQRCLSPFFTTKGERGTGMGLSMVEAMAQRHGAHIDIASEPGRGTTVTLRFPAPAEPSTAPAPRASAAPAPARSLHVLVVDDDPLVLETLRNMVVATGHAVTIADGGRNGIEAFDRARAGGAGFDAVVTDLGMPGVDGRALARAVKLASPSTPVVLLSGWGEGLQAGARRQPDIDLVLAKPPKLRELREVLARLGSSASTRPRAS